ncbi:PHD and RING finger domain-containing protein 1 [Linum grandiflorum]
METRSASPSSSLLSSSSPNKRLKTLHSDPDDTDPNGKQPMIPPATSTDGLDSSSTCRCGICWSDSGKSTRGSIDSCDHYFCFVCIMEWAKIESRCPLCKRRFTAIRRPPKDGVFSTERVVRVPERNQVGGLAHGSVDPLANVECTVCHGSHDESLLLLCDLCDSASHSFCAGLGFTVPEGDWFCNDCSVSRTEHDDSLDDGDGNETRELDVAVAEPSDPMSHDEVRLALPGASVVSIDEIVREQDTRMHRSRGEVARIERVDGDDAAENGARTLRRCRNLHACIRSLRENWENLRTGSLSFSSALIESHTTVDSKRKSSAAVVQRNPVVANDCPGSSASASQETQSDAIDKAWEMMRRATSMQRSTNMQQGSEFPAHRDSNAPKEVSNRNSSMQLSKIQQLGTKQCKVKPKCYPFGRTWQKDMEVVRKDSRVPSYRDPAMSSSSALWTTSTSSNVVHENQRNLPQQRFSTASTSCMNEHKAAARLSTSDASNRNISNGARDEETKREIQSLVKLNLKLLSRDQHLVDKFKEVARVSTHTIMAEFGLEHSKRAALSVRSAACNHKVKDCGKSILVRKCCRECFQGFVKDVVTLVLLSKKNDS